MGHLVEQADSFMSRVPGKVPGRMLNERSSLVKPGKYVVLPYFTDQNEPSSVVNRIYTISNEDDVYKTVSALVSTSQVPFDIEETDVRNLSIEDSEWGNFQVTDGDAFAIFTKMII